MIQDKCFNHDWYIYWVTLSQERNNVGNYQRCDHYSALSNNQAWPQPKQFLPGHWDKTKLDSDQAWPWHDVNLLMLFYYPGAIV